MSRHELVLLAYTTLYNITFCQRARHCCTVHYIYGTNIMCAYTLDVTRRSRTVRLSLIAPHAWPVTQALEPKYTKLATFAG